MYNFFSLLSVASGGACGAILRYLLILNQSSPYVDKEIVSKTFLNNSNKIQLLSQIPYFNEIQFNWKIFLINIVGSFVLGAIFAFMQYYSFNQYLKLFLITGFISSFTTYSYFCFEFYLSYFQSGIILALIYLFASVMVSMLLFLFGIFLISFLYPVLK